MQDSLWLQFLLIVRTVQGIRRWSGNKVIVYEVKFLEYPCYANYVSVDLTNF
jgi:hypothetical protein